MQECSILSNKCVAQFSVKSSKIAQKRSTKNEMFGTNVMAAIKPVDRFIAKNLFNLKEFDETA